LTGSWTLQGSPDTSAVSGWTFNDKGDSIRVTERDGDKTVAAFECTTEGSACEIRARGKKTKVSMWFNGSKLVQMETTGSDIVKRRFGVLSKGDVMEMEVIPVVPSGRAETFQFKRVSLTAQSK
jgi:hypothetical protein